MNYLDKIPTAGPTPELTLDSTVLDIPKPTRAHNKMSKHRISPFKLSENIVNKIVNDGKNK